jgi:hypothetical protein
VLAGCEIFIDEPEQNNLTLPKINRFTHDFINGGFNRIRVIIKLW